MKYYILFLVMALYFGTEMADRDLKAELIILPPLILGYDELQEEKSDDNEVMTTTKSGQNRLRRTMNPEKKYTLNIGDLEVKKNLSAQLNMNDSKRSDLVNDLWTLLQLNQLSATSRGIGKLRRSDDFEAQKDLDAQQNMYSEKAYIANNLGRLLQDGLLGETVRGDEFRQGVEASGNAEGKTDAYYAYA